MKASNKKSGDFTDHLDTIVEVAQKLAKEKAFLEHIISLMPGFVFWKDQFSIYRGCNNNLLYSAGFNSSDELVGKTDSELPWAGIIADSFVQIDRQVIETKLPRINFEEKLALPDGKKLTVLTTKVPLEDEFGEIIGVLAIATDITERKKMEQELIEAKEQAEAALKAKELAEKALREKSIDLQMVLKDITQKKYYLTGEYKGIYLTKREAECLVCLARGKTAKEMAKILKINHRTVEAFLEKIKNKLNCSTKSQLIEKAIKCRFLEGVRPMV